jgi:hypothetical protein
MANGPTSWEDLLTVGAKIKKEQGVQVGIGMSQEIDSNMAARAVLWSFDTALQDEHGAVVLDQGKYLKRSVDAVKYMKSLFEKALTPEVFAWNAASNNQALIAGRASYILNSISAYRSAQHTRPDIAKDVFFTPALKGPDGTAWANVHVLYNYVVPTFAKKNADTAKQFIAYLVANYDKAMYHSKLYNSPTYPHTPVPSGERGYSTVSGAKILNDLTNAWFDDDPFKLKGEANDKLSVLKSATKWTTNLGHPGYANPAIGEVYSTFVIPNMMANAARGKVSPEDAVKNASIQIRNVFEAWSKRGLVSAVLGIEAGFPPGSRPPFSVAVQERGIGNSRDTQSSNLFRNGQSGGRCRSRCEGRRVRRSARRVRLGQKHIDADDRRVGKTDSRRGLYRRSFCQLSAAEGAQHRHGVPELRALPAQNGLQERQLSVGGRSHAGR